jgi:hypothetical protein
MHTYTHTTRICTYTQHTYTQHSNRRQVREVTRHPRAGCGVDAQRMRASAAHLDAAYASIRSASRACASEAHVYISARAADAQATRAPHPHSLLEAYAGAHPQRILC